MTSAVSISSNALILLGSKPISSFADETDRARICAAAYPGLRAMMLAAYDWRFCMRKAELTREAVTPGGQWRYAFLLPGEATTGAPDAIFYGPQERLSTADFQVFGRRLLTNHERVIADLVGTPTEGEWPEYFRHAVTYALAAEIALAVTDQVNKASFWAQRAFGNPGDDGRGGALGDAMTRDAQGSGNGGMYADDFINARAGGWGGALDFRWPGGV